MTAAEMKRRGWMREGGKSKTSSAWRHSSGWTLVHCGHPTALWPWMLKNSNGEMILTGIAGPKRRPDFGTCWPSLQDAADFVAGIKPSWGV